MISPAQCEDNALDLILKKIDEVKAAGKTPVLIFDLDGTLFYTDQRQKFILLEWADANSKKHPEVVAKLKTITNKHCEYLISSTLANLDVKNEKIVKEINDFWWKRFFTNIYLMVDKPIEGGAAYVNKCYEKGAKIVYLTGRDVPNMGFGTEESIKHHKFPYDEKQAIKMLKPTNKMKDDNYKGEAAKTIAGFGEIVGVFENQPKNLVLLHTIFPTSVPVFLDTNFNPRDKTVLGKEIFKIKNYMNE